MKWDKDKNRIINIAIYGLWKKYNFIWKNLNPDVNILIGINGSGKSTLFSIVSAMLMGDFKKMKSYNVKAQIEFVDSTLVFDEKTTASLFKKQVEAINFREISTFDVPVTDKKVKKGVSYLCNELNSLLYNVGGEGLSFSDYRLNATNFPDQAEKINKNISSFFQTVDRLYEGTQKHIEIDPYSNRIVFDDDGEKIPVEKLSSGEKQLLYIMLKVFLMDRNPGILIMDEPENSLHIEWQYKLFEEIRKLNPNCQIISSTHSPSLFGDGWGNNLFFIDELVETIKPTK